MNHPLDVTRPSPNYYDGRLGVAIHGITLHSTRGGRADPEVEFRAALDWLTRHSYTDAQGQAQRNPSIHYIVGHDGRLASVVPEQHGAWHAGTGVRRDGANCNAIGIEMVQPTIDGAFPAPLLDRLVDLLADLCRRHAIPPRRVRTDTVPGIHGHENLTTAKTDPGPRFPWDDVITRLQARLAPPGADAANLAAGITAQLDTLRAALANAEAGIARAHARLDAIARAATG